MRKSVTLMAMAVLLTVVALNCDKDDNRWGTNIPETEEEPTTSHINGYVFRPAVEPATDENVQQLRTPKGFTVNKFAEQLGKPRMLVVSNDGRVYVSDREAGIVLMLEDTDDDGVADQQQQVASIQSAHGLAIHNSKMYIAAIRKVYTAAINADGTLGQPTVIIDDLPDGGQHPNRTLAFGPDGKMYITVGSTCNSCAESNPLNATILQANADGSGLKIYAKGLRNTIGFGWHPQTSAMWGMDHGIDWLGDNEQKEELNRIIEGGNYGWPYIYGEGKYNPGNRPPGDTTYMQYLQLTTLPVLTYQAHAAPLQMTFYTAGQFPAEYRNDAFIAMRGSWNRSTPVGYKVVRLHFENGQPVRFDDFLAGFLIKDGRAHFGRLAGIAVHTDGYLLVSDDTNGVIYRIAYN